MIRRKRIKMVTTYKSSYLEESRQRNSDFHKICQAKTIYVNTSCYEASLYPQSIIYSSSEDANAQESGRGYRTITSQGGRGSPREFREWGSS
ncbi:hypothetical protein AVEN_205871-1 [Araneus ventricosus]|uniref:Uncharacterized protein n=1 Tax=Araneus ventricosus TaxID=182803 RepID=A0A4Y2FQM1_ARAVE|nr:hypothetical protein AVEN_205871-1 [Araneus ventricosus]